MSLTEPEIQSIKSESNYLNHCESDGDDNSNAAYPPHRVAVHHVWTYVKYFVWATISGIFNCGLSVFESPFSAEWSSTQPLETEGQVLDRCDLDETTSLSLKSCESNESYYDPWGIPDSPDSPSSEAELNFEKLCDTLALSSRAYGSSSSLPSFNSCEGPDEKLGAEFCLDLNKDFDLDYYSYRGGILTEPPSPGATAFTLYQAYYSESNNGHIDPETCDQLVQHLLDAVIPRNLSDCSETRVSPTIRKMYAWTDPPAESVHDMMDEKEKEIRHDTLAYPGKLTMSDTSFSPISPITVETTTTATTQDESKTRCDFHLPSIPRHDQTLAWAMANLPSPPEPVASTSAENRQSRDKSPARTINSKLLGDTQSMPTFGGYVFELATRSSSEAEEVLKPKRSSSLKSTRTPPGTPGQKAVRFADAFGLDLATVRHVFDCENPPKIPASATFDLELDTDDSIAKLGAKQFSLSFAQPGASPSFIHRVLAHNVVLEDAHVELPRGVLTGTVRVKNIGFEKHVDVRITYNNWITHCDIPACYVYGSHDGATDRFSFSVVFPDTMKPGDHALFAIRFVTETGEQFWDNNHGRDYKVTCYAKATDLAGDGSWVHYL